MNERTTDAERATTDTARTNDGIKTKRLFFIIHPSSEHPSMNEGWGLARINKCISRATPFLLPRARSAFHPASARRARRAIARPPSMNKRI